MSALCMQACPSCSGLKWCARPGWCLDVSLLAVRFALVSAPAGGHAVHWALSAHVCAAPIVASCHRGSHKSLPLLCSPTRMLHLLLKCADPSAWSRDRSLQSSGNACREIKLSLCRVPGAAPPVLCVPHVLVMAPCDNSLPALLQHCCYNATGELQVPGLGLPSKEEKAEAYLGGLVGRGQGRQQMSRRKNVNARSWTRKQWA